MRPVGCLETSVTNYKSTLCNIPEERKSHLHRGGSLKSSLVKLFYKYNIFSRGWQYKRLFNILCCANLTFWNLKLIRTVFNKSFIIWQQTRRISITTAHPKCYGTSKPSARACPHNNRNGSQANFIFALTVHISTAKHTRLPSAQLTANESTNILHKPLLYSTM